MDEVNGSKIASDGDDSERSTSSASTDEPIVVDFDDVLPHVGELGRYQVILFFLTAPFCFFLSFCYFSQVFITLVPDHWCHVPQLNDSGLSLHQKRELSIPRVEPDFLGGEAKFSSCSMYDVDYDNVLRNNLQPDSSWPTVVCSQGWDYDLDQTTYSTIVSDFDWVCDDAGKAPLAQALFFCGSIAGGVLMGYIADRFGRVPALMLCNTIGSVAGIITAFSNTFALFAFSRFLMGMAFDSCFTLMYILVLEYVGPKYRTIAANAAIALFYSTGSVLLPWIAWGIGDWRKFSLATSVPMSFALLAYWIVPESARWLLSRGQSERAIVILKTFARVNKRRPAESVFQQLKVSTEEARLLVANEPVHTALDLLKTPRLRRNTIFLTLLWVLTAVVYDGHARNTANLPMDVFSVFSLAAVTELPAALCLIIFLDRWGRRLLAFLGLIGAAVFSLATLAVSPDQAILTAALAIIGRFCVNVTFDIGLQYAAELIPTAVRAQGISYVHICGYLAAIVSPYIVDLARFNSSLPLTVLGLLALIGAVMALMLPETLGAILPDTIEDGENFGKDQSFWDFPCCTRRKPAATTIEADENQVRRPSRSSMTASLRGEIYRSSLFNNKSYTSRPKSRKLVNIKPIKWIKTESH